MKLNKVLAALTWYVTFALVVSAGVFSYVSMQGIEIHWSQLILISLSIPVILTQATMSIMKYTPPRGIGDINPNRYNDFVTQGK